MPQDAGWVQLIEPATRRVWARGHLLVDELHPRGWRGALRSLRIRPAGAKLPSGVYIAHFERSDLSVVEVDASDAEPEVRSLSEETPAVLSERSDGE